MKSFRIPINMEIDIKLKRIQITGNMLYSKS